MKHKGLIRPALALMLALAACSTGDRNGDGQSAKNGSDEPVVAKGVVAPAKRLALAALAVSEERVVAPEGATNPTSAYDPKSGAVYLAWAREVPGQTHVEGKDPKMETVVARTADGGKTFSEPVVANGAGDEVISYSISPTQVAVGRQGEVYVLYLQRVPSNSLAEYIAESRANLRVVRSDDGAKTFSAPVDVAVEGIETWTEMATLFVAPDGDLYVSFLDGRVGTAAEIAAKKAVPPAEPEKTEEAHMRIVRSADGGLTWSKSVLVAESTCACCSTKVAQGPARDGDGAGPLFAGTRSEWKELKGSKDSVRDVFVTTSGDDGATWGKPTKIHDDKFKISGCPDVHAGLAVGKAGRLHTAWFTGTERHPGVFYAYSDDDGKTFSQPLTLLTDKWVPYSDVKLVLDGKDRPWVTFEDRRGDVDKITLARVDPDKGGASFSTSWDGTAPDLAAGEDWALVTWQTNPPAGEEHGGAGSVRALVARPTT